MTKASYTFFDVFDTVIMRSVTVPSDVFRLLYRRLASQDRLPTEVTEDAFVSARMEAERAAMAGREECRLADIWRHLEIAIGTKCAAAGSSAELELEQEVCEPNRIARDMLDRYRRQGEKIGFISDTYLPESVVREILSRGKCIEPGEPLFVSSALDKTKRSGTIYSHVAEALGLDPAACRMIGDNSGSDVRNAQRHGWRAIHFTDCRPDRLERRIGGLRSTNRLGCSVIAGNVRQARSGTVGAVTQTSDFSAGLLGPLSMLWALWALRSAADLGLSRLYFLSRDAYPAYLCARHLGDVLKSGIACRYLHVSRRSLLLPAVDRLAASSLDWTTRAGEAATPAKILRRLELTDADRTVLPEGLSRYAAHQVLNQHEKSALLEALCQGPIADRLRTRIKSRRQRAEAYLNSQGLNDGARSALVDVGWQLSIQGALRRLARPDTLCGLYLYLSHYRLPPSVAGKALAMLPTQLPDMPPRMQPSIGLHPTAFEHLVGIAPHGTVLDYDEGATPLPRCQQVEDEALRFRRQVCDEVDAFATRNAATYLATFATADDCAEHFRWLSDAVMTEPRASMVQPLQANLRVSGDPENHGEAPIVQAIGLSDGLRFVTPARFGLKRPQIEWPGGSLAISHGLARAAAAGRRLADVLRGGQ